MHVTLLAMASRLIVASGCMPLTLGSAAKRRLHLEADHAPLLVGQLFKGPHAEVHVVHIAAAPALVGVPVAQRCLAGSRMSLLRASVARQGQQGASAVRAHQLAG